MADPLLTRKAVLLAKQETTYNTDPTPTQTADAVLVEDPKFSADMTVLERNFARNDLDQIEHVIGRKLAMMSFGYELRSNGVSNLGVTAPKIARLLRACGFSQTAISTAGTGQVGTVNAGPNNTGAAVTWAAGGTHAALTQPVKYRLQVTTGGTSATAQISVTPDAQSVAASVDTAQAGVTLTSGSTNVDLKNGGSGLTLTPTWTGSLVVGDYWDVWIFPLGFTFRPVSSSFDSLTLGLYLDGYYHKITGAMGKFSINAQAGQYAKLQFDFTGQYVAGTDAALPTAPVLENTRPAVVELSQLYAGAHAAKAAQWAIEVNNSIVPREDVNSSDGYDGVRLVNREVSGSMDPEMVLAATHDFWGIAAAGTPFLWRAKVGQTAGNRIWMLGNNVQFGAPEYQDRNDIRTLNTPLKFARQYGNDSLFMHIS